MHQRRTKKKYRMMAAGIAAAWMVTGLPAALAAEADSAVTEAAADEAATETAETAESADAARADTAGQQADAAQEEAPEAEAIDSYELEPMTVTAAGYETDVKNAPASVTVIRGEELKKKGYTDLRDILADVEGVDVRSGNGRMGAPVISIRGLSSDYTLILVDGVPQNGASAHDIGPNGFYAQEAAFLPPMSSIERIEVVRGPMSTLYGSDALGGVINIITKKVSSETHGSISIDHLFETDDGRKDTQRYSMQVSGPIEKDKVGFALRGSYIRRRASTTADGTSLRGGNVTPSGLKNWSAGMKLTWTPDKKNTYWLDADDARVDQSEGKKGTNAGYRFDRHKYTLGSENETKNGKWSSTLTYHTTQMYGYMQTDTEEYRLKDSNLIFDTKYVTDVSDRHKLTVGGRYWNETLDSGVLEEAGTGKVTANSLALFAEDTWKLQKKLNFTYGVRYDHPDNYDAHFTPRGYLVYKADSLWTVKGGVSTGFKAPTLAQSQNGVIGYSGGYNNQKAITVYGNPNLKPETSVSEEIGVYYGKAQGLSAHVTLFNTEYKNKIDTYDVDAYTRTYINTGRGKSHGIELGTKIPLADKLDMTLNYTFNLSKVVGGDDDGAPLLSTPRHAVNAKLSWQPTAATNVWLAAEYRSGVARYSGSALSTSQQAVVDALGRYYRPYTVLNLGVSHKLTKDLTLNFAINNLLNKDFSKTATVNGTDYNLYYSTGGSTTGTYISGINYWLGLTYEF